MTSAINSCCNQELLQSVAADVPRCRPQSRLPTQSVRMSIIPIICCVTSTVNRLSKMFSAVIWHQHRQFPTLKRSTFTPNFHRHIHRQKVALLCISAATVPDWSGSHILGHCHRLLSPPSIMAILPSNTVEMNLHHCRQPLSSPCSVSETHTVKTNGFRLHCSSPATASSKSNCRSRWHTSLMAMRELLAGEVGGPFYLHVYIFMVARFFCFHQRYRCLRIHD